MSQAEWRKTACNLCYGDLLFDAIVGAREGTAITAHTYDELWTLIECPDRKVRLAIPALLEWLGRLDPEVPAATEYPFILAAGQRRMFPRPRLAAQRPGRRAAGHGGRRHAPHQRSARQSGDRERQPRPDRRDAVSQACGGAAGTFVSGGRGGR